MTKLFQGKNGGAPFPRTESEWIEKKMSQGVDYESASVVATQKVREDVFGHDFKLDGKGQPIERGKGSASQPTAQHLQAKAIGDEAVAKRAMTMGWHPGLAHAFDPSAAPAARRKAPARKKAKPAAKSAPAAAEA